MIGSEPLTQGLGHEFQKFTLKNVTICLVLFKKLKMQKCLRTKDDAHRTTTNEDPIAIGHLSESGDFKNKNVLDSL